MGSAATAHTASASSFFSRGMSSRSRLREIDGDSQANTPNNNPNLRTSPCIYSLVSSWGFDADFNSSGRPRSRRRRWGGRGGRIISSHNLLEINPDEINFILPAAAQSLSCNLQSDPAEGRRAGGAAGRLSRPKQRPIFNQAADLPPKPRGEMPASELPPKGTDHPPSPTEHLCHSENML